MELHMILETYMPEQAACKWLDNAFASPQDRLDHNPNYTVILNEDNSAYIKQLTGVKQHFVLYPPPQAQVIQKILYSSMLNKIFVWLQNSSFGLYR